MGITENMILKENKLKNIMSKQEDFEMDLMNEEYNKFKENIAENHENILNEHRNELLTKLKQQQLKLNKLSKKQRLKQFEAILKNQQNNINKDLSVKHNKLEETINMVQKQIQHLHEKEMDLE